MKEFDVELADKVCTDVGSSTGGFTDCMLQNGARKVFAIDVGRGQLAWKLRQDDRVVCMEKTNIRYVTPEDLGEPIDFSSIDVSFISLTKVLLPIYRYLTEGGEIVALIKPQFEAGREKVGHSLFAATPYNKNNPAPATGTPKWIQKIQVPFNFRNSLPTSFFIFPIRLPSSSDTILLS